MALTSIYYRGTTIDVSYPVQLTRYHYHWFWGRDRWPTDCCIGATIIVPFGLSKYVHTHAGEDVQQGICDAIHAAKTWIDAREAEDEWLEQIVKQCEATPESEV